VRPGVRAGARRRRCYPKSAIGNRQPPIGNAFLLSTFQHPLQFNPFCAIVDDSAEVLRRGLEQSRREKGNLEITAIIECAAARRG
jgi:hypothetical protein